MDPRDAVGERLKDGTPVRVRAIRPDDESRMARFHAGLSTRSVYQRYFHLASLEQRTAHARLALTCRSDPATGLALVAEHTAPDDTLEVLALARLTRSGRDGGEFALLVMDDWQGRGLGRLMLRHLVDAARALGVRHLFGDMLADNDAMRAVVRHEGFRVRPVPGDAVVLRAERAL